MTTRSKRLLKKRLVIRVLDNGIPLETGSWQYSGGFETYPGFPDFAPEGEIINGYLQLPDGYSELYFLGEYLAFNIYRNTEGPGVTYIYLNKDDNPTPMVFSIQEHEWENP